MKKILAAIMLPFSALAEEIASTNVDTAIVSLQTGATSALGKTATILSTVVVAGIMIYAIVSTIRTLKRYT